MINGVPWIVSQQTIARYARVMHPFDGMRKLPRPLVVSVEVGRRRTSAILAAGVIISRAKRPPVDLFVDGTLAPEPVGDARFVHLLARDGAGGWYKARATWEAWLACWEPA